ncbi:thioredoxin reductase [Metabacillus crassostreae]|uniref:FAD/NAD(P)-binding protein n=1 Tax=Metabacillus crassostreae TaxID=929098 RepID=UPI0019573BED|nr:FAD/NAD(P)-binding protein [Metabacillus crassostreae]MBM7605902.1 thioredoxin reductase [Metabacillus crassostreae]
MNEWIIIGGGLHGCTIATALIKNHVTTASDLKVIDEHDEPLMEWKSKTSLIGMEFLRSPSVHHIDVDPYSLQRYARKQHFRETFLGQYKRPSLELFNDHCDDVLRSINISQSWIKGKVRKIEKCDNHWELHVDNSKVIKGRKVVIAVSINTQLHMPEWVKELKGNPLNQFHIYDNNLKDLEGIKPPVVIIGNGITAAHLTIKLAKVFPDKVMLMMKSDFKVKDFDSDPGWLGPKYLNDFRKLSCYKKRRNIIKKARNKGTITGELFRQLRKLENSRKIEIRLVTNENQLHFIKKWQKENQEPPSILFATGFNSASPGKEMVADLISNGELALSECGYPIVSSSLEWCPNLYVTGPLAELEIGPISRNIAGARHAAEKIVYKYTH